MDASTKDQIFNLIDKSQSILLLTHAKADCDGLGSMISMYLALQALGKEVVAATNDPAPEVLGFLPSINIVQNSISSNNFVITLDIQNTPLNKIKYKLTEDHRHVNIIVTPKNGRFKAEDVRMGQEERHFDLIITFDTGNLEHLGPIYEHNAELFFNTPVINIDHHASNTDYGQVNYVDVVSASTTEMMLQLLREMETRYEKQFLNSDVATLLLAGLITDTGSFQHANTSPRAMEMAAELLDLGARQQEIIKNIYKTKKLSTLKLWGTVLSKVETDPIYRLVWSSITKADLAETGASSEESDGLIDDLLSNAPGAELIMLFKYNDAGYTSVSMRSTTNSVDVGKIAADIGGGGHIRAAGVKRRDGSSLEKLMEEALTKVREYQGNRLNIHPEMVRPMEKITFPQKVEKPSNAPQKEAAITSDAKPESQTVQYLEFKAEQPTELTQTEVPAKTQAEIKSDNQSTHPSNQNDDVAKNQSNQAPQPPEQPKIEVKPSQKEADQSVEALKRAFVSKSEEKPAVKAENKPKNGNRGRRGNEKQTPKPETLKAEPKNEMKAEARENTSESLKAEVNLQPIPTKSIPNPQVNPATQPTPENLPPSNFPPTPSPATANTSNEAIQSPSPNLPTQEIPPAAAE